MAAPNYGTLDSSCPINWNWPGNRGLVGWYAGWPLSGWSRATKFLDGVGYSNRKRNNGTFPNGASWTGTASAFGGFTSLRLTRASTQYVTAVGPAFGTSPFAVGCLFRKLNSGTYGGLLSMMNGGDTSGWTLNVNADNSVGFYVTGPTGQVNSAAITDTNWHLAVATRTAAGTALYIDGLSVSTSGGGSSSNVSSGQALTMGPYRSGDLANHYFDGEIGGAWLWSTAGPTGGVSRFYQQVRTGFPDALRWVSNKAYFSTQVVASGGPYNLLGRGTLVGGSPLLGTGVLVT